MWFDKTAIDVMLKLRDDFGVKLLIETGSYLGVGTRFFAHYFDQVITCDVNDEYLSITRQRVKDLDNVRVLKGSSPNIIKDLRDRNELSVMPMFFLDAHWYAYWPILDELSALKDYPKCIILIHDFKVDGFWYDSYGHDLDLPYVQQKLKEVNPNFSFYTNVREEIHIWTKEEAKTVKGFNIADPETTMLFDHAWVSEDRRYRGCLYAVPSELKGYPLKKVEWNSD